MFESSRLKLKTLLKCIKVNNLRRYSKKKNVKRFPSNDKSTSFFVYSLDELDSRQKPLRQYTILKYYERQTKLLSLIEQTHNFQSKHTRTTFIRSSRKSHKFTLVKRVSNLPPFEKWV